MREARGRRAGGGRERRPPEPQTARSAGRRRGLAAFAPDGHIRHLTAAATVPPAAANAAGAGGHHLVLLARDYKGWSNLCRIISAAHLEHPGEPPLARLATLAEHGGHLVALSGCRRGEVWSRLLAGDKAGARAAASVFHEIFGREFFVELQHELLPDSGASLRALDLLAHELRLPTVATNDVHYTVKADAGLHDVLAAEAANQPLPNPLGRKNAELYLKSPAQMRRLFQRYPEAYANAGRIAERCNLDLGLGRLLFPAYPLPPGETAFSLLWKRCFKGAAERYRPLTAEVTARLERELKVVEELGFAEYFLAVHDIVEFARGRGIYYSGRGSAGNSIVSYVLRICDADPIAHGLLFERFLNPARREMPDVDIDFCSARRDEVIQYIYERFGHDKVAMVATVNTVRAPSAVRIVSRAFGFTPDEINGLSKRVPWGSAAKLGEMLAERPELADHEFQHPHYRRLVHVAERLSGFPAHLGTHLGGFILSRDPLTDRVPLQWAAKGVVVAQFDKDDVETLGLVKMDILALKMHSAIAEAVRRIEARTGEQVRAWELPRDDPEVYKLIRSARTVGPVPARELGAAQPGHAPAGARLRRRHRRHLAVPPGAAAGRHDRAVHQAAARARAGHRAAPGHGAHPAAHLRRHRLPGAGHRGGGRRGRLQSRRGRPATPHHDARALAGRDGRDRPQLRREGGGAGRRAGGGRRGLPPAPRLRRLRLQQGARRLLRHRLQRLGLAQGALPGRVLLRHPQQPAHGVLLAARGAQRRAALRARGAAARRQPERRVVRGRGRRARLRVGLAYVKEMSAAARRAIVEGRGGDGRCRVGEGVGGPSPAPAYAAPAPMSPSPPHPPSAAASGRAGGRPLGAAAENPAGEPPAAGPPRPYTSLADFVARTRVSREIAENLVRLGAFDALGVRREELVAQVPLLYAGARPARREVTAGARAAADEGLDQPRLALDEQFAPLAFLPDWSRQRRVSVELELLGLNVSAHPLRFVRDQVQALGVTPMARLPQVAHGRRVRLAGVLERAQMPWIRSGHRTMFLTLEDETELGQVVVFNDVYLKYGRVLKDAIYLLVEGELQNDEEHGLAVVAHQIMDLTKVLGRTEALPGGERRAGEAGGALAAPGSVPGGGFAYQRPDAWELPAVEPRTRPGRTG